MPICIIVGIYFTNSDIDIRDTYLPDLNQIYDIELLKIGKAFKYP